MEKNITVLSLLAHPDDAEFQCAGTLALLEKKGWKIVIASMTPGQAGSVEMSAEEISTVRRIEAANSASLLKGTYECLESEDIFIMYDRPTLLKATELFRRVNPAIVFTASPSDYIVDHEVTSKIARTACMAAGIPNIQIPGTNSVATVPYLYYCEPTAGKDIFGHEIESDIHVDISSMIDIKEKMLSCHESQRSWLQKISKVDEYLIMMKDFSRKNGEEINSDYAEGFRQHLGFSYPSNNILKTELGDLVHI
jgi:LmbE family N-acetylglucosaminyl deacetylase